MSQTEKVIAVVESFKAAFEDLVDGLDDESQDEVFGAIFFILRRDYPNARKFLPIVKPFVGGE